MAKVKWDIYGSPCTSIRLPECYGVNFRPQFGASVRTRKCSDFWRRRIIKVAVSADLSLTDFALRCPCIDRRLKVIECCEVR